MDTLKEKTAKGLFWGGLSNAVQQLAGLVFGILLGRLLSADDYGMLAIINVYAVIAIALQNSGFAAALTNLKTDRDEDYNSVFWFNILVGSACYAVLFLAAPLLGLFYGQPAVVPLSRFAFLNIIVASWGTAQNAWLFKHLRAKQQAKAGMVAVVVSSVVGVAMAFAGCRYWALATQNLLYVCTTTLLAWHYSPWRPTLHIDLRPALHMLRFSGKIMFTTITTHVNNNVLNILLGYYYTERVAGFYNQAYQWNYKCSWMLQGMVNQVTQPVLSGLNDAADRQLAALRKLMRFAAFLAFPMLLGFGMVAHEFIVVTITEKWLPSVPLLRMLSVMGCFVPLSAVLSNALITRGKSGRYWGCTAALAALQIAAMMACYPYGVKVMTAVYTVLNVAWFGVWWRAVRGLVGYRLTSLLADTLPFALAAAAVMAATAWATAGIANLYLLLAARIALAAALYYLVMKLSGAQILKEAEGFVKGKIRR